MKLPIEDLEKKTKEKVSDENGYTSKSSNN